MEEAPGEEGIRGGRFEKQHEQVAQRLIGRDERTLELKVEAEGESCALGRPEEALVGALAFLPDGTLLGLVRVGPMSGEEPHLLYGHTALVTSVAVSPDGKWIASAGEDGTIRLWPMPGFGKPPLHTLKGGPPLAS